MKLKSLINEIKLQKLVESTSNELTMNVGGTKYKFKRNGHLYRLGSEPLNYGNMKLIGATTYYGHGNRNLRMSDVDISIKQIFENPDILVGAFPLTLEDGIIRMNLGNSAEGNNEHHYKVLWVR